MSLNDKELGVGKGVDVHPGVANPTTSSTTSDPLATNFVTDPTTDVVGAGAGPNFEGHRQAQRTLKETAGVVEGRPGIIESTNIDPLNENSNKDDGWANATREPGTGQTSGGVLSGASNVISGAANVATGAGNYAYGQVSGDEGAKAAGKEAVFGK